MAASGNVYASAPDQAFQGLINYPSDSIKLALLQSTYTPSLTTHVHWSDVSAFETTASAGYTTGGVAIGTKTHAISAANSFATSNGNFTSGVWIASTAAAAGNVVRPISTNGYLYLCVSAGTTGASAPTWPTVQGQTVVDSGATWCCIGESITIWSSATASWTSPTFTGNVAYAVLYDSQSGTASTEPLLALNTLAVTYPATAYTTFSVAPASLGWFWMTPA